ncbi:sigma-70 family RNA polymerase sigma factor [Nucisporomicrobium flavum]|uniref:sigma-70 family RNA polymerase sigma factor n=1 Tax=Nucisporomicrobium flavum TaxID=2785915 RepID=UPI0018F2FA9B|nr:sigma-70 family RNA polymerase sigma factor [Nucisporomicrobium flavum]
MSSLAVSTHADPAGRDRATIDAIRSMRDPGCPLARRERLRQEAIRRELPLARHLAHGYADRGEPIEDLVQVAALALVKAVDGFDPDRGTSFAGYAYPTILGELKRHFRDRTWSVHVPRRLQELCLDIARARTDLLQQLHHEPTAAQIAEVIGVAEADVRAASAGASAYRADSLNRPVGSADDPCERQELLGAIDPGLESAPDRVLLEPALRSLPERARYAVRRYFFDNRTQDEIAAELHVSQMSVSRLLNQALARLRSRLAPATPESANGDVRVHTYEAQVGCVVATVVGGAAPVGGELRYALVDTLVSRRPRTLVVDLRRLTQPSVATAQALMAAYSAAGHVGARLCVVNIAADLLALLQRTGVTRLMPCRGVAASRRPEAQADAGPVPAEAAGSAPQRATATGGRGKPPTGPRRCAGTSRRPAATPEVTASPGLAAVPVHRRGFALAAVARTSPPAEVPRRRQPLVAPAGTAAASRPPYRRRRLGRARPPPPRRAGHSLLCPAVRWRGSR